MRIEIPGALRRGENEWERGRKREQDKKEEKRSVRTGSQNCDHAESGI